MSRTLIRTLCLLLSTGCAETSGAYLELPVIGSGVAPGAFESNDGWSVELTRAEVAFGPFWACSTEVASPEFCPEAVLELRETVAIDGLSPEPELVAMAQGRRGIANTAMWDLGISWLPTQGAPAAQPGAPGAHSARFEGRATHPDGRTFSFSCDLDLEPQTRGALVTHGRSVGPHPIESEDDAMLVAFDVRSWWRVVAFEVLWSEAGDAGHVVLEEGEPQYDTLRLAVQSSREPAISWAAE